MTYILHNRGHIINHMQHGPNFPSKFKSHFPLLNDHANGDSGNV